MGEKDIIQDIGLQEQISLNEIRKEIMNRSLKHKKQNGY